MEFLYLYSAVVLLGTLLPALNEPAHLHSCWGNFTMGGMKYRFSSTLVFFFVFSAIDHFAQGQKENVETGQMVVGSAYQSTHSKLIVVFEMFQAGKTLIRIANPAFVTFGKEIFYGSKKTLFQLNQNRNFVMGKSGRFHMNFNGPAGVGEFFAGIKNDGKSRYRESDTYEVVCGEKHEFYQHLSHGDLQNLQDKIRNGNLELVSLPAGPRIARYLFSTQRGDFIFIDAHEDVTSSDDYRFFLGKPGSMKQIKIISFSLYTDGGSIKVETKEGTLWYPAPMNFQASRLPATWTQSNPEPIGWVELRTFDLSKLKIPEEKESRETSKDPCEDFKT